MNVLQIIEAHLRSIGADGLCADGCGCELGDLAPCRSFIGYCEPAKKHEQCMVDGCEHCQEMTSAGEDFWMVPMTEEPKP